MTTRRPCRLSWHENYICFGSLSPCERVPRPPGVALRARLIPRNSSHCTRPLAVFSVCQLPSPEVKRRSGSNAAAVHRVSRACCDPQSVL
jgi:hypothetical protein